MIYEYKGTNKDKNLACLFNVKRIDQHFGKNTNLQRNITVEKIINTVLKSRSCSIRGDELLLRGVVSSVIKICYSSVNISKIKFIN